MSAFTFPARDDARTGFESNLTAQQRAELAKLKGLLAAGEYAADVAQNPDGDRWVLRFLRASMRDKGGKREFDADAAHARILQTLEWRREHGVDKVRWRVEAGEPESELYARYRDELRPRYDFIDSATGRLVRVERFAATACFVDAKALTEAEWTAVLVEDCERIMHALRLESKRRGHEVATNMNILDQRGSSLAIVRRIPLLRLMNDVASLHYPELVAAVFLVNCARAFTVVFSVCKPFLDAETLSKIHVSSSIPKEKLAAAFDPELLPVEFGGRNPVVVPACAAYVEAGGVVGEV